MRIFQSFDFALALLRVGVGGMMLLHGISKLESVSGVVGMVEGAGLPGFLGFGVYVGEIVAPLMLILGLYVRTGAALIIFTMLVAIALTSGFNILALNGYGGWVIELQALYILPCLVILMLGGGRYKLR